MMAEMEDPKITARKIVSSYLSKLGWTKEWRRNVMNNIPSNWEKQDLDQRMESNDTFDKMIEEAEYEFSLKIEELKHSDSKIDKEILYEVYQLTKNRHDLGFFGKEIVAHLRKMFET